MESKIFCICNLFLVPFKVQIIGEGHKSHFFDTTTSQLLKRADFLNFCGLYHLNRYEFSRLSSFFHNGIRNIYSGKIGFILKVKTDEGLNKLSVQTSLVVCFICSLCLKFCWLALPFFFYVLGGNLSWFNPHNYFYYC